jgi:PKD repeat protein
VPAPFSVRSGSPYILTSGQTSFVTVAFLPTASGSFTNYVFFNSNGGAGSNLVTGAAITPPMPGVHPTNLVFPTILTGTIHDATFVVTNKGQATLTGTASVSSVAFSIVGGSPFTLLGGGSTNVVVRFQPPTANLFTTNLLFRTNGGDLTNQVAGSGAAPPIASFTASPTNGLVPLNVTFTDTSAGTVTNRFWDFGNGSTTNVATNVVQHSYGLAGTNTVTLIATGPVGVSTNVRTNLIVVTNLPPQLAISPTSRDFGTVTVGLTTTQSFQVINAGGEPLTGSATAGGPFAIAGGSPFNVAPFSATTVFVGFTPPAEGGFANSVIFNSNGGISTNTVTGFGAAIPVASFSGSPTTGAAPLAVTFTDTSTGTITNRFWNFGNGATTNTTGTVVFHTYPLAGTNTVTLIASGPAGASTNTRLNYIVVTNLPPPVASFTASPTNGLVPLPVTFTDTSTGSITNRFWNFGDGGTTNTTATSVVRTYSTAGTNTVTLIVSGPVGADTNTRPNYIVVTNPPAQLAVAPASRDFGPVTIGATNTLGFSVINSGGLNLTGTASVGPPFAVSAGSPYNVLPGQTGTVTVSFIPTASSAVSNGVVFASNGGNSTNLVTGVGLTPAQLAVSPGALGFGFVATGTTAQASFVVTNLGGSALSGTASVGAGAFSILSGTPFNVAGFGATNVVVAFTPPTASAFSNGVVFASNGGNATNAVTGQGAIMPLASFTGAPTAGVVSLTVTFTDTSTGTITNRFWTFGDGASTNTTATSLAHTYTVAGTNTVRLIVSGPVGISTNTRANYIVVTNPPAQLAFAPPNLDFGAVAIGQTNTLSFQVFNTGGVPLTGTATVNAPFAVTSGSPYNVAPGATGVVQISFSPSMAGTFDNSVVFVSNGGTDTADVLGVGITPGEIGITPTVLDFGTAATGTTVQAGFVVTNTGGAQLDGTASVVGGPFVVVAGSPFSVAGFGTTNVTVSFTPPTASTFSNQIVLASSGGTATNQLVGRGAIRPQAQFSGSPTNGAAPLTVTFTDTSTGTITNRFWTFGDGASSNTLATSVTRTYTLPGTNTVRLIVSGPVGSSTNTRLNYIIVGSPPPSLVVTPASRDFGVVAIGQTSTLPFQVSNPGGLTLTGTASVAGPFAVSSGSPYSVPPGQTGVVQVSFIPVAGGFFTNPVLFASNGGGSTNIVTGQGVALSLANFTAAPTNGKAPLTVTFTDTSTGTITNRVWSFGDGAATNTTATSVTHTYVLSGTNTVSLIVQGPAGATTNTKPGLIVAVFYPPGDMNGDFRINTSDSLLINQVLVGLRSSNDASFAAAGFSNGDVNRSGVVSTADSLLINQTKIGLRSYLVTGIVPGSRTNTTPTAVAIYGISFPTNGAISASIGPPVNLPLSNLVVVSREEIRAFVPAGGALGTGTVQVVGSPTNGVLSFGTFINR